MQTMGIQSGAACAVGLAGAADAAAVLALIGQGRRYFAANGIPQWQNGYPDEGTVAADIAAARCYVLRENGRVAATAVLAPGPEPSYACVFGGAWHTLDPYCAVHRVAVGEESKGRGLGGVLLRALAGTARAQGARSIRADTHRANASMRRLLEKSGFCCCGVVYLADGAERLAYERPL